MVFRKLPLHCAIQVCPAFLSMGLFASLVPAQSAPVLAPYRWQPVRIVAGGYIPGLIAHPTQSGLIYARTDIGSVYRSNAATQEWIPLTDFHSQADGSLQGPESVALDPTDPNRLYIAAGMYLGSETAILVSTDQGATFTTHKSPPFQMASNNDGRDAGERLQVNPFNPSELFMGTRTGGLWKSEDYAQTWNKVMSFPVQSSGDGFGVQWVLFDRANSGTVYAGVYTTSTVYRSTDDGSTWNALPGQPLSWPYSVKGGTHDPAPMRAVLNPDGSLYVTYGDYPGPNGMNYGLVEKFNVAAGTWSNVTPPLDTSDGEYSQAGGFCGISQDPNRQGTVAVATQDRWWHPSDTIYITHDGGATWIDLGAATATSGINGLTQGNYYYNPSVFLPVSPWLTLGNRAPNATAGFGWWLSSLLIDPVNPDHLMYATGASLFATDNVSVADSGQAPTWYVQALGIEETDLIDLISPTAGAHLLSAIGDIGGFRHDDLSVSPPAGMFDNPTFNNTDSLDWAGQNPLFIARVGEGGGGSTSPCTYGATSTDGGTTWTPFGGCAAGGNNNSSVGSIAVDASGSMMMWTVPAGASAPQYSTDNGASWNAAGGLVGLHTAVADKVTPKLFYAFDGTDFVSTTNSGGTVFAKVNQTKFYAGAPANAPVVNFARAGDLWLPLGNLGLYHSTDGGVTWTAVTSVLEATMVSVGAPNPRARNGVQSVFLYGVPQGAATPAIFRSDDNGSTWMQIDDSEHQYGGPNVIVADSRVYGRVFVGTGGRGIVYGDIRPDLLGGGGAGRQ